MYNYVYDYYVCIYDCILYVYTQNNTYIQIYIYHIYIYVRMYTHMEYGNVLGYMIATMIFGCG